MDVSRRRFLQASSLLLAASAFPWPSAFGLPARLPILQGMTDDKSTSIIIQHPTSMVLNIKIEDPSGPPVAFSILNRMDLPGTSLSISEIFVSGLNPGLDYRFNLFGDDGALLDQRRFGALNIGGTGCRFAILSCMNDNQWDQEKMWAAVADAAPQFIILDGDTCYADQKNNNRDEAGYASRYSETRGKLGLFQTERLIPCFATWDDHDFGLNNGDKSLPIANFTRGLFRTFWGSTFNSICRKGMGVGSVLELCGQRFVMMDDRSYRDVEFTKGGRHWGEEQWQWLLGELNSKTMPTWLVNGSQFFGGYLAKESFEADHAEDFKNVLTGLSKVSSPIAFVSGDVHFSEIMAIEESVLGYNTFEFTSSSIHSGTFPGHDKRAKNPRRLMSEWRHNFLIIESDVSGKWTTKTACIAEGGDVMFQHTGAIGI